MEKLFQMECRDVTGVLAQIAIAGIENGPNKLLVVSGIQDLFKYAANRYHQK